MGVSAWASDADGPGPEAPADAVRDAPAAVEPVQVEDRDALPAVATEEDGAVAAVSGGPRLKTF